MQPCRRRWHLRQVPGCPQSEPDETSTWQVKSRSVDCSHNMCRALPDTTPQPACKQAAGLLIKLRQPTTASVLKPTCCPVCQEDEACAGAPHGLVLGSIGLQLWYEAPSLSHQGHGGALAARDDQAICLVQLLLGSDLKGLHSGYTEESGNML